MASTFYASADGTVFHPVSDEALRCAHDSAKARERLAEKLKRRKESAAAKSSTGHAGDLHNSDEAYQENYVNERPNNNDTDLSTRRVQETQLRQQQRNAAVQQRQHNRVLAEDMRFHRSSTKAIPSNYVYKPGAADNKHARAIVHHTGSHYVMAGSRQFQRGVRVKGVVSRHSKQGARLQAKRMARKNAMGAREDARGQRSEGGRSLGKQKKKGKKKKKKST